MREPSLVIMAAGMGSRYGGLKQIDPVGQNGELIIDFSIFDALRAGFKKVVFIIKKQDEIDFREAIGDRIGAYVEAHYVYQDLEDLPSGYSVPEGRSKPWGTGQAILACKKCIDGPFAVINADDYYGREAFEKMYAFLKNVQDDEKYHYAMVGYTLKNTLTEHGHVARGVCEVEADRLVSVCERTHIAYHEGSVQFEEEGVWHKVSPQSLVSMNLWGFTPSLFGELEVGFKDFLNQTLKVNPLKGEYFIPSIVDRLIREDKAQVQVLHSTDRWYGVTYKEDKPVVVEAIRLLQEQGLYPLKLWEDK